MDAQEVDAVFSLGDPTDIPRDGRPTPVLPRRKRKKTGATDLTMVDASMAKHAKKPL